MLTGFRASRICWVSAALALLVLPGCGRGKVKDRKYPRPVSALVLTKTNPSPTLKLTGVVSSWKTEQIGFEVPGKVLWVLEPGRNIKRRIEVRPELNGDPSAILQGELPGQFPSGLTDEVAEQLSSGDISDAISSAILEYSVDPIVLDAGEPLAQLDPSKFVAAFNSAEASLDVAESQLEVASIQLDDSIEAEIASAQADLNLAQNDYDRFKTLRSQNAISQAELDNAFNRLETQKSRMANLVASKSQAEEEKASAKASVERAEQARDDAERDLENTKLFGFYQGQVSEVHVVPGSIVQAGTPILTLQMMNPIKIEVEVSAAQSREIQKLRQVPITFQAPNEDKSKEALAFVYLVDPAADLVTRTFTVTLLVLNTKFRQKLPEGVSESANVARTEDVWPADLTAVVASGSAESTCTFEKGSIKTDESQRKYVWVATNAVKGEPLPDLLEVSKAYIETLGPALPFLGNWEFKPGRFLDSTLAARADELMVAGDLSFPDGPESTWDGKVFVDRGMQWMLRPGDLVTANVSEQQVLDWYVPAEFIFVDAAKQAYLFLVEEEESENAADDEKLFKAKRVKIDLAENAYGNLSNGELIRFSPGKEFESYFEAGAVKIVSSGVQFLIDKEQINVTEEKEFSPTEYRQNRSVMPRGASASTSFDVGSEQPVASEVEA